MWQVSDRFLATIRHSPTLICVADVLDQGGPVPGFSGLPVVAGSITRDRTAANFARCSLQVASPDLAPLTAQSPLSPAGFEIQVQLGVQFPDGDTELAPVGVYGIQSAVVDAASKTTQIEGVDRSKRVQDALLEAPVVFAAGHDPGIAALALIADALGAMPPFDIEGVDTDVGGHVVYDRESDPWQIATDIFKANGAWIYFGGEGELVGRPEPDVTTTSPVWVVDEGDGGALVDARLSWDREPAANKAIVTGTNTEFAVTYTGTAVDNDPASPSFYGGRFGAKPIFLFSAHVTSTATAVAAAKALLRAKQGLPMSLDLSTVPNVALEAGDVVRVESPTLGVSLSVVLDSITVDVGPEAAMTCQVRARQESTPEGV